MDRTRWIIFGLIVVATLGGLVLFSKKDSVSVDSVDAASIIKASDSLPGDNVYGNKDAKVILFEYADFQCPGCAGAYAQLKQIKQEYKDQVAFVLRNFPLTTIHPNALAAATAAEAAAQQGKYWEMHDKLYENQPAWQSADTSTRMTVFGDYAHAIGLDTDQFRTDLSSAKVSQKISRDRALASKVGVSSTPTFFIGSEKVDADTTGDVIGGKGDKLRDALDAALKEAGLESPRKKDQ